jgi:hypothetical protein
MNEVAKNPVPMSAITIIEGLLIRIIEGRMVA